MRTPRGRVATSNAYAHFGLEQPTEPSEPTEPTEPTEKVPTGDLFEDETITAHKPDTQGSS